MSARESNNGPVIGVMVAGFVVMGLLMMFSLNIYKQDYVTAQDKIIADAKTKYDKLESENKTLTTSMKKTSGELTAVQQEQKRLEEEAKNASTEEEKKRVAAKKAMLDEIEKNKKDEAAKHKAEWEAQQKKWAEELKQLRGQLASADAEKRAELEAKIAELEKKIATPADEVPQQPDEPGDKGSDDSIKKMMGMAMAILAFIAPELALFLGPLLADLLGITMGTDESTKPAANQALENLKKKGKNLTLKDIVKELTNPAIVPNKEAHQALLKKIIGKLDDPKLANVLPLEQKQDAKKIVSKSIKVGIE